MQSLAALLRIALVSLVPFTTLAAAQDKPAQPTAASLIEQAVYAEEHERDFAKAALLFNQAIAAAKLAKDGYQEEIALSGVERARSRAAGIGSAPTGEDDPLVCRVAARMLAINSSHAQEASDAYRDLALLGSIAVPWLERAIRERYELCHSIIEAEPPVYVRALAQMSAPEGVAALERQLSSPDPMVRRAVAQWADPVRHRAVLLRALKDPAEAVRGQAIDTLSNSRDSQLSDVLRTAAKEGNSKALSWFNRTRPEILLELAQDASLDSGVRSAALGRLARDDGSLAASPATLDLLLAIARTSKEPELRETALYVISESLQRNWTSLDPMLARRIEAAVLAAPDDYPHPAAAELLATIGGARSLRLLVDRLMINGTQDQSNLVNNAARRIIGNSKREDFPELARTFGSLSAPMSGVQRRTDLVFSILQEFLSGMARQELGSAEIAAPAQGMGAGVREIYIDRVVAPWIQAKILQRQHENDFPPIDPAFLALMPELASSSNTNFRSAAASVYGATRDPKYLPQLVAMIVNDSLPSNASWAIQRIVGEDRERLRTVLELLLTNPALQAERLPNVAHAAIGTRAPDEMLGLVEDLWSKHPSIERRQELIELVASEVPGPQATAFLVTNYKLVAPQATSTRKRIISRIGSESYEPGMALIGEALRGPDASVRAAAGQVFASFREQRELADSFDAWLQAGAQASKTTNELVALLESSNSDVVIGAVQALAAAKSRSAVPTMIRLLEKHRNDEAVKAAVKRALDDLAK